MNFLIKYLFVILAVFILASCMANSKLRLIKLNTQNNFYEFEKEFSEYDGSPDDFLLEAVSNENYEIAKLLLDKGANPNLTSGDNPKVPILSTAVALDSVKLARLLLEYGADANSKYYIYTDAGHIPSKFANRSIKDKAKTKSEEMKILLTEEF